MTSSSSTGGMGSAGSMVWRAKLLSLRSRYVISGWSLLRKQQKMKEIPRPLLFLGAMAKILCVPPSWALDPKGKRREEAQAATPQRCAPVPPRGGGIKATHALGAEGKSGDGLRAKYFCSDLTFTVLATLTTARIKKMRLLCLVPKPAAAGGTRRHPRRERGPGPPPLLQISANPRQPSRAVAARPAPVSVRLGYGKFGRLLPGTAGFTQSHQVRGPQHG